MLKFEFQSYLKMQLFFMAAVRHIEALNLNKNFSLFSPPHTLYWAVIHSHSRKTKLSWNNLDDRSSLTVCSSQKKKKSHHNRSLMCSVFPDPSYNDKLKHLYNELWHRHECNCPWSYIVFHFFCSTSLMILSKCPESLQKQLTNNW